jgi:YVTN family beta-propeller protein
MSELRIPPHVLTEIGSPIREKRLSGVDELTRIAAGTDLQLAAAARAVLQRMTEDDSRSVAASAAASLERTAVRLNPDRIDFGQVTPETPQLAAEVSVEGPPLAVAAATLTVSGPGLRAMLDGRRLHIVWQPRSDWLDGSVTVRGPAGWADVRVTGQIASGPMSTTAVEARLRAVDSLGVLRTPQVTVLPAVAAPVRRRRRAGTAVLAGALVALVVLGGAGVAMALTMRDKGSPAPVAAAPRIPAPVSAVPTTQPGPSAVAREPLAKRIASVDKPAVAGTIKVGNEPEGLVVSPDGRTVYVADQSAHVLSVVDVGTRKVTSVKLRNTPRFVTTSRDGKLVFVSMYETNLTGSGVAVIDAASHKVLRNLTTGTQPYALSIGPDGKLWVPIHSAGRVEIYDPGTMKADGRIQTPPNPHSVGFSSDLMRAFTPDHESNVVSAIDMDTGKVIKSVPVSNAPHSLAVSPDGRRVLVAAFGANAANLIDASTLKRTGPFPVGKEPQSASFSADGEHGYIVNEGDNTVSVLDGHTGKVTATVKVGHSPRYLAVSPDGRSAYVSNGQDDTISVLRVGE